MTIKLVSLGLMLGAVPALAGDQQIPFWPDEVQPQSGRRSTGTRRSRPSGSSGVFIACTDRPADAAAAEQMRKKLLAAGLADVSVERLPADGKTRYAHFLSYLGWDAVSASLEEVSPLAGAVGTFLRLRWPSPTTARTPT